MFNHITFSRVTALLLGAAAGAVSMYAAYEAAARYDGGYLMVAAPVIALAAAAIPVYAEIALRARQWFRVAILAIVWVPCAAMVFFNAIERVHLAKAGAEAERYATRTVVARATTDLNDAKVAADTATKAANKVRGLDTRTARSAKASETAALTRLAVAQDALKSAEAKAISETSWKQPEWLLPLSLDMAGLILIPIAFGLGRRKDKKTVAATLRSNAAKRGAKTRRANERIKAARKLLATKAVAPAVIAGGKA